MFPAQVGSELVLEQHFCCSLELSLSVWPVFLLHVVKSSRAHVMVYFSPYPPQCLAHIKCLFMYVRCSKSKKCVCVYVCGGVTGAWLSERVVQIERKRNSKLFFKASPRVVASKV